MQSYIFNTCPTWAKRLAGIFYTASIIWGGIAFSLLPWTTIAQHNSYQNTVWTFGDHAGLDFSSGTPVPFRSALNTVEGGTAVSDINGRLLFYSDGSSVWNRQHSIMPNGNFLAGDPILYPTASTTQSAVAVQFPDGSPKYYLFSLTDANIATHLGRLSYSIIDMSRDNGLGDIIPGSKTQVLDSMLTEKMLAVPGNRCNIWLLVHAYASNTFKAYEITANGLNPAPVVSVTGAFNPPAYFYGGVMKVSPNREWLVACTYGGGGGSAELFRFDPETGQVNSFVVLDDYPFNAYYGAEFSADNSRLYLSTHAAPIIQYDLSLASGADIVRSAFDITTNSNIAGMTQGDLKLGPDGKIYVSQLLSAYLGVISSPNQLGNACNYTPNSIQLLADTWSTMGLPNNSVSLSLPVSETVDTALCFFSGSLDLDINPGAWDVLWDDGSTAPSRNVASSGIYHVDYFTAPCIRHRDTFKVNLPTLLPRTGLHFSSCKGLNDGSIWFHPAPGDSSFYRYTWKDSSGTTLRSGGRAFTGDTLSNLGAGRYTLHLEGQGCDTFFTFELASPAYELSFSLDSIVCAGDTADFQNHSSGIFTTWEWDFGDGYVSTEFQSRHRYELPGNYRVRLTAQTPSGCIDSMMRHIIVDPRSEAGFEVEREEVCVGAALNFYPKADSTGTEWIWDFGDDTESRSTMPAGQHAYDRAGIRTVRLKSRFRACPELESQKRITVHPLPEVDLGEDRSLCLNGRPVYLTNLRTDSVSAHHQIWNTGDTSARLRVVQAGRYTLQVINEPIGCSGTASVNITKDCYLDIPNAFTPDGDGHNDYFIPRQLLSKGLTGFRMQVRNRWGQLVFESNTLRGRGWDGRLNGNPQPAGVYLYLLEADFADGRQEQYSGNLTLIR